jgi:hypothetical protein
MDDDPVVASSSGGSRPNPVVQQLRMAALLLTFTAVSLRRHSPEILRLRWHKVQLLGFTPAH